MEFLAEYGLFLLKAATIVIAFIIVISAIVAQAIKAKSLSDPNGDLRITHLNKKFDHYQEVLHEALTDKDLLKKEKKAEKKAKKAEKKAEKSAKKDAKADDDQVKPRVFVIPFEGDVKASAVEGLREAISAVLTIATEKDEVLVNIESPGGMVHTYGLAASQLERIKEANIPLTVCVDKVAASGGYLMACVADKIIAAPFAIIGSIGVLAQIPNFHRLLKKHDVDYNVMTSGEHKAPITFFGEITDKAKTKLQSDLEDTHSLFKNFILKYRSQIDMDQVATGEIWYGQQAIDKLLVDEIMTSDSYLLNQHKEKNLYMVSFEEKKTLPEKLGLAAKIAVSSTYNALLSKEQESNLQGKC